MSKKILCTIMRGGTSKGVFFREKDLPSEQKIRNKIILSIFGSPDPRQIDGLGGADSLTSKCAIIRPSSREDADIDYTIGNVSITMPLVDYSSNCGNLSSAVAAFAVDEGLVSPKEPTTSVRMFNTNTQKLIIAEVPVKDGKSLGEGDYSISGVPGMGAKILLDFRNTVGSVTGKLLPTGNIKDIITLDNENKFEVSIVDVATPMVFVRASDVGKKGTELPGEINSDAQFLEKIEKIRSYAAKIIGIVDDWKKAAISTPATPKVAFVTKPTEYEDFNKQLIKKENINFVSRIMSMQKLHKAYAITGAICTAVAAKIEGTIVNEVFESKNSKEITFAHPSGTISVEIKVEKEKEKIVLEKAAIGRTARRIMDGFAYIPDRV